MHSKYASAIAALLFTAALADAAVNVGDRFPAFDKAGVRNVPETKGKGVLVDFWASWCAPCRESFPAMDRLYQKYRTRGFVIVAVNVDDNIDDMKDFLGGNEVSFPVVRDGEQKLVATAEVETMPTSFLIGRDGKVTSVHNGFHGSDTEEQLTEEIERLLK